MKLPGRGGKPELERFVGDLASEPLDINHPFWTVHIIEKYEGGAALVFRWHHAIADGVALIAVTMACEPLAVAGSTLKQSLFWVPQTGDIGMGVSIYSYAGTVQLGLITDAALTPDPEAVVSRFPEELEKSD